MKLPLTRMLLRSVYDPSTPDHPQKVSLNPHHSTFGKVRNSGHRAHQGWDLSAPPGTPVFAIASGIVEHAQDKDEPNAFDHAGNYGRHILLSFVCPPEFPILAGRKLFAFYAHLDKLEVSAGQEVDAGQKLGTTGKSGKGARHLSHDEAHLHFEIRTIAKTGKGLPNHLDPELFFQKPPAENLCRI